MLQAPFRIDILYNQPKYVYDIAALYTTRGELQLDAIVIEENVVCGTCRMVKEALTRATEIGQRNDLDITQVMYGAVARVVPKHCASKGAFDSSASAVDWEERVTEHLSRLMIVIHVKGDQSVTEIVALCLIVELGRQLKFSGHDQAASVVRTMVVGAAAAAA